MKIITGSDRTVMHGNAEHVMVDVIDDSGNIFSVTKHSLTNGVNSPYSGKNTTQKTKLAAIHLWNLGAWDLNGQVHLIESIDDSLFPGEASPELVKNAARIIGIDPDKFGDDIDNEKLLILRMPEEVITL
jgi:hypothetical protein